MAMNTFEEDKMSQAMSAVVNNEYVRPSTKTYQQTLIAALDQVGKTAAADLRKTTSEFEEQFKMLLAELETLAQEVERKFEDAKAVMLDTLDIASKFIHEKKLEQPLENVDVPEFLKKAK